MDPRHLFIDDRLVGGCVYCGLPPDTREHVPSRVLLDEPYPRDFPVVGACRECNESYSLDEQYLACFLDCVISGTTKPSNLRRPGIERILEENPRLRARIEASRLNHNADELRWQPEIERVRRVALKLARGHAAYELYPMTEGPRLVNFGPLQTLSDEERNGFENPTVQGANLWPEIGSRAFLRASGGAPDRFERAQSWLVVQPGRYRYAVVETGGMLVRMVLSEYLACEVLWD